MGRVSAAHDKAIRGLCKEMSSRQRCRLSASDRPICGMQGRSGWTGRVDASKDALHMERDPTWTWRDAVGLTGVMAIAIVVSAGPVWAKPDCDPIPGSRSIPFRGQLRAGQALDLSAGAYRLHFEPNPFGWRLQVQNTAGRCPLHQRLPACWVSSIAVPTTTPRAPSSKQEFQFAGA